MNGLPISPGIAIANPLLFTNHQVSAVQPFAADPVAEKLRFRTAVKTVKDRLSDTLRRAEETLSESEKKIFKIQIALLEDPELIEATCTYIDDHHAGCEYALEKTTDTIVSELADIDDAYIRERITDIHGISTTILHQLTGICNEDLSTLSQDIILVAREIEPSQLIMADKQHLKGIVCEVGGATSHIAILCRNYNLPAVSGIKDVLKAVGHASRIYVNGNQGTVIVNPDEATEKEIRLKEEEISRLRQTVEAAAFQPGHSSDGKIVKVCANISGVDDAVSAAAVGAEGIGLFRTEFMFMDTEVPPSEETQLLCYKKVLQLFKNRPVTIRTLDAGGDKNIPYLELQKESNPFLGCRAIRLCLRNQNIFRTQLRALLRASVYGNLRIMYPMISSLQELQEANQILEEVKQELQKKQIPFAPNIKVGMMVEIPSAAVCADIFAENVDFFSIGTNDLIQYTLAVDRTNSSIAALYDECNPSIIRLLDWVVQKAHEKNIPVGLCGEVGSHILMTSLLLGMEIDELSVSRSSIARVKYSLSRISSQDCYLLKNHVLQCDSAEKIRKVLTEYLESKENSSLLLL